MFFHARTNLYFDLILNSKRTVCEKHGKDQDFTDFRQKALFNPTHKIYTDLEVEEIQMCIFRGLTSRTIDAIVENNGAMPEE